ncbi:hypothetical protein LCGC14_2786710, partial [marine sediment metagenome]
MKQKWHIEITDEQNLWLENCYLYLGQNNPRIVRELKAKLYPKISASFNPNTIDSRLLLGGAAITLLGILHVDPNPDWLQRINRLLKTIKNMILQDPTLEKIDVEQLVQKVSMDRQQILKHMNLVSHYGPFWDGHSLDQNGLKSLSINSDAVYDAYLKFESIEDLIDEKFVQKPIESDGFGTKSVLFPQSESE